MSRADRRAVQRALRRGESVPGLTDHLTVHLVECSQDEIDETMAAIRGSVQRPLRSWRSLYFSVQLYAVPQDPEIQRLSIRRSSGLGRITWDEVQAIKAEVGFGAWWASHLYPPDDQVVQVANMLHLWLLPEAPTYAWRPTASEGAR